MKLRLFFFKGVLTLFLHLTLCFLLNAQSISGIITDYNGYWKSSLSSINGVKPSNSHNLLAFTYNGVQYSTGVNNELLSSNGENFVAADFWSLPVASITGSINSNTKIGLGALYDGVYNGPSNPAPENNIPKYLTDGIKGLDLGTCIANLPVGTLSFYTSNLQASAIGDGVPDIIVTQIADPTGNSFDRYEFVDENGVRIGNYKDIVFTNIAPIGNWIADFYEARNNPMTLNGGFTQTERPLRLWAADLSEFGITSSNLSAVHKFQISLCGNSDVAFVAYNNRSISITNVLPIQIANFKAAIQNNNEIKLSWQAQSEASKIIIQKSSNGKTFTSIDSINGTIGYYNYSYTDRLPFSSTNFYRLKIIHNKESYSNIIQVQNSKEKRLSIYPNPAHGFFIIKHPGVAGKIVVRVYTNSGILVHEQVSAESKEQTFVLITNLIPGAYYVLWTNGTSKQSIPLTVF